MDNSEPPELEMMSWSDDNLPQFSRGEAYVFQVRLALRISLPIMRWLFPNEAIPTDLAVLRKRNALALLRGCLALYCKAMRPDIDWPRAPDTKQKLDSISKGTDEFTYTLANFVSSLLNQDGKTKFSEDANLHTHLDIEIKASLGGNTQEARAIFLRGPDTLLGSPLFPFGMKDGIALALDRARTHENASQVADFWLKWADSLIEGKPLDWKILREVLRIPDEDWEKGPERIAEVIRRIEAEFIGNTLKERIEFSVSGRLTLVAQPVGEERQLGYLLDTVQDALDLATAGLRNELPDDSYQARLLRRTFTRYANDPQRIEMDFERARVSLVEDMAAEAIPASAANRDLIQSLSDAAGSIRDSNPEIAESRDRLNRIRLAQVSPEQGAQIAEIAVQVAAISEDILREDLLEDRFRLPGVRRDDAVPDPVVPIGAAERNAALEAQAAQLRLYSRLTKVWLFLKENDREIAIVGSLASIIGLIVSVVVISS